MSKILPRRELVEEDLLEEDLLEETELLAIEFVNRPWIGQEIVSLLTFDLCAGWSHEGEPDAIIVACRSVEAARYLKWKLDTGPLDWWVNVYYLPVSEHEPDAINENL